MTTITTLLDSSRRDAPVRQSRRPLPVRLLGFAAAEMTRFDAIFRQQAPSERCYSIAGGSERSSILVVNYDNPAALQQSCLLRSQQPDLHVVAVSKGPLANPPSRHIRGLLLASRVLSVLDTIAVPDPVPFPSLGRMPFTAPQALAPVSERVMAAAGTYRVLVVDDSLAVQKSLELKLAALAEIASVDCAADGESALQKAAASHYDVIFLDVVMPGIDGYETCAQLRKLAQYKKTPIVMVSAKTSPLDEVKGVIAGCTTYLTKPVQDEAFQKLGRRILAWLGERQATAKISA